MIAIRPVDMAWAALVVAAAFNVGANVLLKSLGQASGETTIAIYFTPTFLVAGLLFGVNLLAYTQALKVMPLSVAYPMLVVLSTLTLAAVSVLSFGDTIPPQRMVGYLFLLAALYLIGG